MLIGSPDPLDRVTELDGQILGREFQAASADLNLKCRRSGAQQGDHRHAAGEQCKFDVAFHGWIIAFCLQLGKCVVYVGERVVLVNQRERDMSSGRHLENQPGSSRSNRNRWG